MDKMSDFSRRNELILKTADWDVGKWDINDENSYPKVIESVKIDTGDIARKTVLFMKEHGFPEEILKREHAEESIRDTIEGLISRSNDSFDPEHLSVQIG